MGVLRSLIIKEFRQFRRNPFMPKLVIMYPVLIVLVIPWVTTMDIRNISVGIVDSAHSEISGRIISDIDASAYLDLEGLYSDYDSALNNLENGHIDAIMEIPAGFGNGQAYDSKKLSIHANGVNAIKGALGSQYLTQTVMQTMKRIQEERGMKSTDNPVEITSFYNPSMDYKVYMIPALMVMLLIIVGGFLPALNLVIEKETGTIEQINVSPVGRFAFTLSKLIPYWIFCFVGLGISMVLARLVYGMPVTGSVWSIFLASALFVMIISAVGVMIANLSDTMQQTMFLMLFVILSFILLSGLMTPVESMPEWAQTMTWFLPPSYMIDIIRAVYLKGATMAELWIDFAALGGFAVIFCAAATFTYRKRG